VICAGTLPYVEDYETAIRNVAALVGSPGWLVATATERYRAFLASAEVDWSDKGSVIEYLVGYQRMLAGGERPFDETGIRELVRRDVERARNIASSENHGLLTEGDVPDAPLSSISAPTLVIHGTADPMFPPEHGQALADEIPEARLLILERAGHGVDRADWEMIAEAVLARTAT